MTTGKGLIAAVPTNIITGFLGSGKTSAILQLLKHKAENERWAVLVNEFGEIGVDGSLFRGQHREEADVFIREVPGGCMCCAAGLPMQIALNQLLQRARPQRLLIEPTGLGHPQEVLQVLRGEYYKDVLALEKIITLIDARKLSDERYTTHPSFVQQIEIADVLVANKKDLYSPQDLEALSRFSKKHGQDVPLHLTEQGALEKEWLVGATASQLEETHHHHHPVQQEAALINTLGEEPLSNGNYARAENAGEGFRSIGWRVAPQIVFDYQQIFAFLSGLKVERMKAVFITTEGVFGYNLNSDALTEMILDDCLESRIEIIAESIQPDWENQLLACSAGQEPELVSI